MSMPDLTPLIRASRPAAPNAARYDFATPRAISDRQTREVADAHVGMAEELAAVLGDALGEPVRCHCGGVAEVQAQDVLRSRAAPTVLFTCVLETGHPFVLDLSAKLALFLVGRQLGGGDPLADATRGLSELERAMVEQDWVPTLTYAVAGGWAAASIGTGASGEAAAGRALGAPDATVVVTSLDLEVGGESASVSLAYPIATLRALLGETSPEPAGNAGETRAPLDRLEVEVCAELGRARLHVSDLAEIVPGDVIPLGRAPNSPVPVRVGDRLQFDARAGTREGRLALELLSPPTPIRASR